MRRIDWNSALSDEDVAWLRQAGFMSEEQIARHQAQFDAEVPEDEAPDDLLTKSAMDASARVADPIEGIGNGAPAEVVPTEEEADDEESSDDEPDDDYDEWTVRELEDEVAARNAMADTSSVTVVGTGKNDAIRKPDLVKGLRLWDQENPGAIKS